MTSAVELTARAHPVNAWLLYTLGKPVLVVDGVEHPVKWKQLASIPVAGGKHSVAVGFRYRGTPWLLGTRERSYVVPEDGTLRLSAMNGPLNSEPFFVEISTRMTSPRRAGTGE